MIDKILGNLLFKDAIKIKDFLDKEGLTDELNTAIAQYLGEPPSEEILDALEKAADKLSDVEYSLDRINRKLKSKEISLNKL